MNENQKYNKQIPYEIKISIASAIEAMEYWLSNEFNNKRIPLYFSK